MELGTPGGARRGKGFFVGGWGFVEERREALDFG